MVNSTQVLQRHQPSLHERPEILQAQLDQLVRNPSRSISFFWNLSPTKILHRNWLTMWLHCWRNRFEYESSPTADRKIGFVPKRVKQSARFLPTPPNDGLICPLYVAPFGCFTGDKIMISISLQKLVVTQSINVRKVPWCSSLAGMWLWNQHSFHQLQPEWQKHTTITQKQHQSRSANANVV